MGNGPQKEIRNQIEDGISKTLWDPLSLLHHPITWKNHTEAKFWDNRLSPKKESKKWDCDNCFKRTGWSPRLVGEAQDGVHIGPGLQQPWLEPQPSPILERPNLPVLSFLVCKWGFCETHHRLKEDDTVRRCTQ